MDDMPPPVSPRPEASNDSAEQPPITPLPWETPGTPVFEAFFETLQLFIIRPGDAYARMRRSGDLGRPILYAIFIGWAGVIVSQLYSLAFQGMVWHMMPQFHELKMQQFRGFNMTAPITIVLLAAAPVLIVIGLFIWTGIVHVMLLILGGANEGLDATFRVMSYATTAQVAQFVPICGNLAGGIWALVLEIIGIAEAHHISHGKAALAVLLPLGVCCACIAGLFALSSAAILSTLFHAGGQMQ